MLAHVGFALETQPEDRRHSQVRPAILPALWVLFFLGVCFPPQNAYADSEFELMVGAGINSCVGSGDASCTNLDSSYVLLLAPGVRFSKLWGVYADMSLGALDPTGNIHSAGLDYTTTTLMPTVRVFHTLSPKVVAYGGVGVGYSSQTISQASHDMWWSSTTNMKFNFGLDLASSQSFDMGINIDYVVHRGGQVCMDGAKCADFDGDVNNLLQATGVLKFYF